VNVCLASPEQFVNLVWCCEDPRARSFNMLRMEFRVKK
jgi:hypothetical protein